MRPREASKNWDRGATGRPVDGRGTSARTGRDEGVKKLSPTLRRGGGGKSCDICTCRTKRGARIDSQVTSFWQRMFDSFMNSGGVRVVESAKKTTQIDIDKRAGWPEVYNRGAN